MTDSLAGAIVQSVALDDTSDAWAARSTDDRALTRKKNIGDGVSLATEPREAGGAMTSAAAIVTTTLRRLNPNTERGDPHESVRGAL